MTNFGLLSGDGTINGTVVNYGEINPGNCPGELTINGDFTQDSLGTLVAELGGDTQGTDYDWLNIIGKANLAGYFAVDLYDNFTPYIGETFSILTATDGITGTFDSYIFPNSSASSWIVDYDANAVVLKYTGSQASPTPEPPTILLFGIGLLALIKRNSVEIGQPSYKLEII